MPRQLPNQTATVRIENVGNHRCTLPSLDKDIASHTDTSDLSLSFSCPVCGSRWRFLLDGDPPQERSHEWLRTEGSSSEWREREEGKILARIAHQTVLEERKVDEYEAHQNRPAGSTPVRYAETPRLPPMMYSTKRPKEKPDAKSK